MSFIDVTIKIRLNNLTNLTPSQSQSVIAQFFESPNGAKILLEQAREVFPMMVELSYGDKDEVSMLAEQIEKTL